MSVAVIAYSYCDFSLEELYLSGNDYEDVTLDITPYQSLRMLQLTSNGLSEWQSVLKLDTIFPRLKNLIVAYNNIATCGECTPSMLPSLA